MAFRFLLPCPLLLLVLATSPGDDPKPAPRLDLYGDPLPPGAVARLGTVRLRHYGWSSSIAFLPDDKTLLSGNEDGTVRFWDVATGRELRRIVEPDRENYVRTIALSPDGKTLAVGGRKLIRLWDVATGRQIKELRGGPVRSLAFTPDGKTLISGGEDHAPIIRVWDLTTGKERRRMMWHQREVAYLACTPDGKRLLSASTDWNYHLCDLETGQEVWSVRATTGRDEGFALSPDGKLLAVGGQTWQADADGNRGVVRLVDLATGKEIRKLGTHKNGVNVLTFSADGQLLASGTWDATVAVWDLATGKALQRLQAGTSRVKPLLFSPNGKTLAAAGGDAVIRLWDIATGKLLHAQHGHGDYVRGVVFSGDGKLVASSSGNEKIIRVWDRATGKPVRDIAAHDQTFIWTLQLAPDGKTLISAANDSTIRFVDIATGAEQIRLSLVDPNKKDERGSAQAVRLTPDGSALVALCPRGDHFRDARLSVLKWELPSGKQVLDRTEPGQAMFHAPAISPRADKYVMPGAEGLALRDVETGKVLVTFKAGVILEQPFVFSPNGELLALRTSVQKQDGNRAWRDEFGIRLFEVRSGKEVMHFSLKGWHQPLAFTPDGRALAAAADEAIHLFDLATGKELWRSPELAARASCLTFDADGATLASGLPDTTILLWDLKHVVQKGSGGGP